MSRNTRAEERPRVCHCGWSKVTTYHGLRTHQGKNECTPRGLRIPEEEQDYWRRQWERRHQPVKRESFSEESSPERPRANVRTNLAAAGATVNGKHKPTLTTSQRATRSRPSQSGHQDQGASPLTKVHSSFRDGPVTPPSERVVRPKERITEHQKPPQRAARVTKDSQRKPGSYGNYQTPAATINKEPRSSPQPHFQRAGKAKAGLVLQVNRLVGYDPVAPPQVPAVRPEEKDRKYQSNRPVRENPATKHSGTVVRPKQKHREDQTLLEMTMKTSIISPTSADKDLDSCMSSAALRATICNGYKPTLTTPQQATKSKSGHQDFSTLTLVGSVVREHPVASSPERVVRPKEKTAAPKTSPKLHQRGDSEVMKENKPTQMLSVTANQEPSVRPKVKSLILTYQSSPPRQQQLPNQRWIKNDHRYHTPQMSRSQRLQQPQDNKSRKMKKCG